MSSGMRWTELGKDGLLEYSTDFGVSKSYLMKKELWDMVETVDRKSLSKLIEKGILTEEELKGTYDVETRYSLHVSRV
jgi:hypothetical protein